MSAGKFIHGIIVSGGWLSGAFHLYARVDWLLLIHLDNYQFWTVIGALACTAVAFESFERHIAKPLGWVDAQ